MLVPRVSLLGTNLEMKEGSVGDGDVLGVDVVRCPVTRDENWVEIVVLVIMK